MRRYERVTEGGLGFTWSDFGSEEQRKRHVKPNPDRLGPYFSDTT
ncbi:hypothetical protein HMPREF9374_0464 [Desmospora sp. 8437]|nr:hypothetical protein HMPREF9374_0464 [Desmospora sp. 8437]